MAIKVIWIVVVSYLIGSLPFSYWIGLWRSGIDIRYYFDGNVGAHNVARVAGVRYGILASLLDACKGFSVGIFASVLVGHLSAAYWLAGISVLLGHMFPFLLRFRGGKGISTIYGFIFTWHPPAAIVSVLIFILLYFVIRNFDLSLAIGMISLALVSFVLLSDKTQWFRFVSLMALIGIKKLIDLPYEHTIKEQWEKGFEPRNGGEQ